LGNDTGEPFSIVVMDIEENGAKESGAIIIAESNPSPTSFDIVVSLKQNSGTIIKQEYLPTELPEVTQNDAGKFLRVSADGLWVAESIPSAEGASF
jgi:hypothetical protein